jgi:hypothetical protein
MGSRSVYEESLNWSMGLDVQGLGEYGTPRDGQSTGGQTGDAMGTFSGFGELRFDATRAAETDVGLRNGNDAARP